MMKSIFILLPLMLPPPLLAVSPPTLAFFFAFHIMSRLVFSAATWKSSGVWHKSADTALEVVRHGTRKQETGGLRFLRNPSGHLFHRNGHATMCRGSRWFLFSSSLVGAGRSR